MRVELKRTFYLIITVLTLLIAFNFNLVWYGLGQAKGQFKVLWNAKSIEATLTDPQFPDSLKANLKLVSEIKNFAIDSLGLKPTKNYTTVFDQKGEEILWVVSGCDPYEFNPRMWSFPIIGSFTYKGFFNKEKAKSLLDELKEEGLDVYARPVSGWSTLGWFKDPILSNMLADSPGELANTIIHELTHGTIFIPDSMTFNENLATFIGNRGAEKFLAFKYGADSNEFLEYTLGRSDSKLFTSYIVKAANELDSLYKSMLTEDDSIRLIRKTTFINRLPVGIAEIDFHDKARYASIYNKFKPNNAYFISFLNYRQRQDEFDDLYFDHMKGNLRSFVEFWKESYAK